MARHERVLDVYWQGPIDPEKFKAKAGHVLYAIYGQHHVYGRHALLYIGRSRKVGERLGQHRGWVEEEYDEVEVRVASIGKFQGWKDWMDCENDGPYGPPSDTDLAGVEALLIHAHQPAYNTQNTGRAKVAEGLRIFNTGKPGPLLPEVSYIYHLAEDREGLHND